MQVLDMDISSLQPWPGSAQDTERRSHMSDEYRREALEAALAKQRRKTTTSDGFMFRGKFYAQPGAMKKLLNDDFDGFCSLAGTQFEEITPMRGGEPLRGFAVDTSISAYKA